MNFLFHLMLWFLCLDAVVLEDARAQDSAKSDSGTVAILMVTELGTILCAVDSARAPRTAANFLAYVDAGLYNGGRFFRTVTLGNQPNDKVKIEVIQCDIDSLREEDGSPPIRMESTAITGILHREGTLSMARSGPNSATSSVFICINEQPDLNFGGNRNPDGIGFAAFGRVTNGMEIVRKIHQSSSLGQRLIPPIKILSVMRAPH